RSTELYRNFRGRSRSTQPGAPRRCRASLGWTAEGGRLSLRESLLRRLSQDQVAFCRRQRDGALPDLVFHPHADYKILALLPRADPLVAGREEDPAVGFGIARRQRHGGGIEALRAEELDELGRFLFALA